MPAAPTRTDRVLAIDPGKMTGLAWMRHDGGTINLDNSAEASADDVIEMIRPTLLEWRPEKKGDSPLRIVVERFIITTNTAQKSQEATWALETIGAVKQACRDAEYPIQAICWQKPVEAKNAFPNDKLKSIGLWHRGGEGHALDAIRHGALYLAKVGWVQKYS